MNSVTLKFVANDFKSQLKLSSVLSVREGPLKCNCSIPLSVFEQIAEI